MKTNKIYAVLLTVAALVFGSCSSDYLTRDPIGGTLILDQYEKLPNSLEGSLRGLYNYLYSFDDHDAFGLRSIDMYTDLLCGDMALTSQTYGWFYTDESEHTRANRSGYLWSLFYRILHNTNAVLRAANNSTSLRDTIAVYGLPNDGLDVVDGEGTVVYSYSDQDAAIANSYAQALTIRAFCYSKLVQLFCPTPAHIHAAMSAGAAYNLDTYPAFPVYTENNMDDPQPMAPIAEVYERIENDLTQAISYWDAFGSAIARSGKLEVDVSVARTLLAYSYLNKACISTAYDVTMPRVVEPMTQARKYAEEVIYSGKYNIIPQEEFLTTGFNNVENTSWMWGEDVTTETATGLGSFFGQVDIHSYSYAWAGDTKVIDKNLYDQTPEWDGRSLWFNDGSKNQSFLLCPDGKFFSTKAKSVNFSTASDDIDREWLSDNVFMRVELAYLIAAEACYFLNDMTSAVAYLDAIMSERLNPENITAAADYATFKSTLTDRDKFIQELYRNWRLELWGEGYGLQTFRRLGHMYYYQTPEGKVLDKVTRGANHLYNPSKQIEYTDESIYTMTIPSSETTYNPHMQDD